MNIKSGHRGAAIIMAMITLAVSGVIIAAYLLTVTREHRMTYRSFRSLQALNLAEAGIEQVVYWFNNPSDYSDDDAFVIPRGSVTEVTQTVLTDNTKSGTPDEWTSDEWIGDFLVITSGNAEGNRYTIDDNDATSLTCSGDNLTGDGVEPGDTYFINTFTENESPADIVVSGSDIPDIGVSGGEINSLIVFKAPEPYQSPQVATVQSTATVGGVTRTVEVVVEIDDTFPSLTAAAHIQPGAGWSGTARIHWGKVYAEGNVDLPGSNQPSTQLTGTDKDGDWDTTPPDTNDPWLEVYAEQKFTDLDSGDDYDGDGEVDTEDDQPFYNSETGFDSQYEHYYQDQTIPAAPVFNYEQTKEMAKSLGTYYYPASTAQTASLLDENGVDSGYRANQLDQLIQNVTEVIENQFVFIDFVDQVENGTLGDIRSSGTLYAEVSAYIGGNLTISGSGDGQLEELTRPDGETYSTNVNIIGWVYTAGTFDSTGNPVIYGALVIDTGLTSGGTPIVYYNSKLAGGSEPPGAPKVKLVSWEEKI